LPAYSEKELCIFLPASGITTEHSLLPSADLFTDEMPGWYGMDNHQPCSISSTSPGEQSSDQDAVECPGSDHEGSCLCGSISYRVAGEADAIRACHCSRCRQRSGGAWFSAMPVVFTEICLDGDEKNISSFFLPDSQYYGYSFCSICGTVIPTAFPDGKRTVVAAGSLESTPPIGLKYHIYYESRAPWVNLNEAEAKFNAHPPTDFDWEKGKCALDDTQ